MRLQACCALLVALLAAGAAAQPTTFDAAMRESRAITRAAQRKVSWIILRL